MTIRRWFHPNWCGDFRLEDDPDKGDDEGEAGCLLKVKEPTPAEIKQLGDFLAQCRKRKWISKAAGVSEEGLTTLKLKTSVTEAGKVLMGDRKISKGTLTAVKHEGGELSIVMGGEDGDTEVSEETAKPSAEEAVTTTRPTLCCPVPVEGPEERASEVLRAFCTNQQWRDWQEHGYLFCRGGHSGHLYRIVHRENPLAARQGKITWDMADDAVIHAHARWLPAPEEVLTLKLWLENAENSVRNPSSCLSFGRHRMIMHNPHMAPGRQGADGTDSAATVGGMARGMKQVLRFFGGKVN